MPRKPNDKTISSTIDPDLYEQLRRFAFETRQTHRAVLEAALREYLGSRVLPEGSK